MLGCPIRGCSRPAPMRRSGSGRPANFGEMSLGRRQTRVGIAHPPVERGGRSGVSESQAVNRARWRLRDRGPMARVTASPKSGLSEGARHQAMTADPGIFQQRSSGARARASPTRSRSCWARWSGAISAPPRNSSRWSTTSCASSHRRGLSERTCGADAPGHRAGARGVHAGSSAIAPASRLEKWDSRGHFFGRRCHRHAPHPGRAVPATASASSTAASSGASSWTPTASRSTVIPPTSSPSTRCSTSSRSTSERKAQVVMLRYFAGPLASRRPPRRWGSPRRR
jgi:hypothetical protein